MRYYLAENVFDAALNRIRRLYDEFDRVVVAYSGGKDSVVVRELCMIVAEERGKLPLPVMFLDQEGEWDCVIDHVRDVMYDPRVQPYWMQIPLLLWNSTSSEQRWLDCWHEENRDKWIRERDPISYKENVYGTMRFKKLLGVIPEKLFPDELVCVVGGVRCEESPTRFMAMTGSATYKDMTWGRMNSKTCYSMYPIYDWSLYDIWKAIHENEWPYCKLYDYMYQYGVPLQKMRVSNINHETAIGSLTILQEIEPDTWNRVVARMGGANAVGQNIDFYSCPDDLPYMFKDWREYRDHLFKHLVTDPQDIKLFSRMFTNSERWVKDDTRDALHRVQVRMIMRNDSEGTLLQSFRNSPSGMKGLRVKKNISKKVRKVVL